MAEGRKKMLVTGGIRVPGKQNRIILPGQV